MHHDANYSPNDITMTEVGFRAFAAKTPKMPLNQAMTSCVILKRGLGEAKHRK